jgi:hypothetical protein
VWISTPTALYPNLYTILVGTPAMGKSRAIGTVRGLLNELPEFPFAPTSVTMAALVDALKESERKYTVVPNPTVYYNTLVFMPDEWQVLFGEYNGALIAGFTTFYDVSHPYREQRRTGDLRVEIKRPQLTMLAGTTPSQLFDFIPEQAWSQGFTSRLLLVYCDETPKRTVRFSNSKQPKPTDLIHDLKIINSMLGEFRVEPDAIRAFENWISAGEPPVPTHKRLEHYLGRRYPHLLKLCMVSSVDRGNSLSITVADFNRALGWIIEAERLMPRIFQDGPRSVENKIMEEVHYYMTQLDIAGTGVAEHRVKNFVLQRVSVNSYRNFFDAMQDGGYIKRIGHDKLTKESLWTPLPKAS